MHDLLVVQQVAVSVRVLQQNTAKRFEIHLARITHAHVNADGRGSCAHHRHRLRMNVVGHEPAFAFVVPVRHRQRFGRGGGLVQQGRVGHFHAREIYDQRLEVQQTLQPALADFLLVGRVGRQPAGQSERFQKLSTEKYTPLMKRRKINKQKYQPGFSSMFRVMT